MTTTDIFFAVVVIGLIFGLVAQVFSYMDVTALGYINSAFVNLPNILNTTSTTNAFTTISYFWPTMAGLAIILLIAATWVLSFNIKASPLAAVYGTVLLWIYTGISFYVANAEVMLEQTSFFSAFAAHASFLVLIWVNGPILLAIAGVVDIGISILGSQR